MGKAVIVFGIFLLIVAFAACRKEAPDVLTEADWRDETKRVVLFLGDSLTEGYSLSREQAYPALTEAYWKKEGIPLTAKNAGISGDTTAGVLTRLDSLLTPDVVLVFLAIGANDGLRATELTTIRANLETIIDRVQAKGIKVAIAGMRIPVSFRMGYAKEFHALYAEVAKAKQISLMPFLLVDVAGEPEFNIDDRFHPNARGHEVMARNVLKFLNHGWGEAS